MILLFSLLLATGLQAFGSNIQSHDVTPAPVPSQSSNPKSEDLAINDGFAQIPTTKQELPTGAQYQTEEAVTSLMLSLWSMTSGQTPSPQLLAKAGLDSKKVVSFIRNLPTSARLTTEDRELLRKSYTKDSFPARNAARNKYMAFVSRFQDKFPDTANVIPEVLTVWGEARNIRGFDEVDSFNQQAKMATIIHVIRNRTERRNQAFPNALSYKNKWNVVTRRYQFSAFEPYDPNLAELAFGPRSSAPFSDLSSLPRNDRIALSNLAKVIASMNRGEVMLAVPLVYNNTYHYLTPTLMSYNKENQASLRASIARAGKRLTMLQIPSENPQYLTVVPRWSLQSALITHPPVKIKDPTQSTFQTQIVSPSDFIYFRGIR